MERKKHTLVEMARTMLDEHITPRCFWADAISIACYISNRIFPRLILHLTPFELHVDRKPSVSHKYESQSSDDILLGYTPHGRSYRVFNLETNTIVE
jgi:hypothetical protein